MDTLKSVLTGMGVVIAGLWALIGAGVLLTAWASTNPANGTVFVWQWFTWIWIAPELSLALGVFLLIFWGIGEQIRGQD